MLMDFSTLPSHSLWIALPFGATRANETLFSITGIHHDDRAHMITLKMFTKVFFLYIRL